MPQLEFTYLLPYVAAYLIYISPLAASLNFKAAE